MEEFRNLKRVAINELKKLDATYMNKEEFTEADAKKYDCMMHGLKCQLTAEAMLGAEGNASGMRSREGNNSYADGYSAGYSEGMRMSGHYPPMQPDPWRDRRW